MLGLNGGLVSLQSVHLINAAVCLDVMHDVGMWCNVQEVKGTALGKGDS